jgi:hypothetical protein
MGDLDGDGLPLKEGVYSVRGESDIDVYDHPIKGLSCFSEDFGSEGTGVDDETDCHVSVQNTGLEFISRVGGLVNDELE